MADASGTLLLDIGYRRWSTEMTNATGLNLTAFQSCSSRSCHARDIGRGLWLPPAGQRWILGHDCTLFATLTNGSTNSRSTRCWVRTEKANQHFLGTAT